MKRSAFYAFLSLLSLLALVGCGADREATAPASQARTIEARTEVAALQSWPTYHAAPATVVARERVEVTSRLMGYIRDIAVVEGQTVKAGQRLFTVDPVDVEGQVELARHAVQQAEDAWRDAVADHDRHANLFKEDVVTRQQYEKMKLNRDLAATRLAQAKAQLATATGQLRYAAVSAPMSGVITRKLADRGDLAAPGQPVLVLESAGPKQVETQVPEDVLARIKPGQVIQVEVDGLDRPIEARVARTSPAADPQSRTFLVKLDVAAEALRSGTFARALFPLEARQAIAIPASALVRRAGIEGVFVVDGESVARFRMVRSGEARDGRVEIQAGLEAGERYVAEGAEQLSNGDRVKG
jgi:RND family efflux transporter MFP subunit